MTVLSLVLRHARPIAFVALLACVAGLAVLPTFPVAILPEVTFPRLAVIAEGGDRPQRVMEIAVTRVIEEAIATVPGVRRVRARTQRGSAELSVDFAWGADMAIAQQLVNTRIGDARHLLPPDANVQVERMAPTMFPILGMSLRSSTLSQSELWSYATYELRPRLAAVPGVARVVVQGGDVPEALVEVRPDALEAAHLSIVDVQQALAGANVVRGVGRVVHAFQQEQILVSGQLDDLSRLADVGVAMRGGHPLTVGMLADVRMAAQDRTTVVTADGAPCVLVNVIRQPTASTLDVTAAVQQALASAPRRAQVSIATFYDQSVLIREAVGSVRDAVLLGGVLVVGILLLFLGDMRATLVTAIIIPCTVLITFLLMRLCGQTLNLMTLGALAVGVGLIIDDAIVVVENVHRHLARGEGRAVAVRDAMAEIAAPMTSSTITTVVVFLPLCFTSGVVGQFFDALAITLAISLLVSLVLALTVSPGLSAQFLSGGKRGEAGFVTRYLVPFYEHALARGLRHRSTLALAALAVLVLTALMATRVGTGFLPEMDEGAFIIDFWTPPGTSLAESDRLLRKIDGILQRTPEVASFSRRTGTEMGFFITEPNKGDYAITLKCGRRRPIDAVQDEVRDAIGQQVSGVTVEFAQVLGDLINDLSGADKPVVVKLFGSDAPLLESTARRLAMHMGSLPVVDVKSGVVESNPELVLDVDPLAAGRVGLTTENVASQMEGMLLGDVSTWLLQGDHRLGVRVRYPAAWRDDSTRMATLPIRAPAGFTVPLSSLGTLRRVAGTTELTRENQRRVVSVTAHPKSGVDLGTVMREVQALLATTALPSGVSVELGGSWALQRQAFWNLALVLGAAVALVFTVMLFGFGTFRAPIIIVLLLPFSLFGVVGALWISGTPFNVSSFMGAIMLVGIVVKNGILLLDRAQAAENAGATPEEAVLQAGRSRLQPIVMTTLASLLGLLPLALGIGAGAQMQQPLAIAVIGGLTFSTFITLVLAPMLYVAGRASIRRS